MVGVKNIKSALLGLDKEQAELHAFRNQLEKIAIGKNSLIDISIASLISGGHLLIEDVPGVGKSTFIRAFARLTGLQVSRIQCTSDLLPADIIGIEVFDSRIHEFVFHKGPVFSEIVFVDELNRASPRTQSALLEAMGEGQVSIDRKSYLLPQPFMVFASQNPEENYGTFPLPESQLDRFAAKIHFGYPDSDHELNIFKASVGDPMRHIPENIISNQSIKTLWSKVDSIHVSENIAKYVKRFIDASRFHPKLSLGVSTRGGVTWIRMAKAIALLKSRDFLIPDDLQMLAKNCLSHRISSLGQEKAESIVDLLIQTVPVS